MLFIIPTKRPRKRVIALPEAAAAPGLTLVSASYDPEVPSLTLTFDADINTDAMVLDTFRVSDGQYLNRISLAYTTTGLTANSVTMELAKISGTPGSGVTLDVGAGNGIVAADTAAPWHGVTGLALPFG